MSDPIRAHRWRPTRSSRTLAHASLLLNLGCGAAPPSPPEAEPAPPVAAAAPEVSQPLETPSPADAPKAAAPWIDLPVLIGLDQHAMDAVLGAPTGCESVSPSRVGKSPKCSYRDGNVEIVFIQGKADWITVYGTDSRAAASALDVPFDASSLAQLGLSGAPTASSPIGVFWKDSVPGVHEVSMFGQRGGKVSYFYVKAFTD